MKNCWLGLTAWLLLSTPAWAAEPMDSLVTADWLAAHLEEEDVVVIDSTVHVLFGEDGTMSNASGADSYAQAHIPGAIFADLLVDLSAPGQELIMPDPDDFAAALGALGIDNDDRVVIYSTGYYVWGARLWWMMRWIGHDNVALLDGGMRAWEEAGLEVATGPVTRPPATYVPAVRPELVSSRDDVLAAIADEDTTIIDALSPEHYRGEFALYARPGHIPTAMNVPTTDVTDGEGRFRPTDELELLVDASAGKGVITYCGGGVAAAGVAFAAVRAGVADVSVYMGSLQEWAADPDNPLVVGEE